MSWVSPFPSEKEWLRSGLRSYDVHREEQRPRGRSAARRFELKTRRNKERPCEVFGRWLNAPLLDELDYGKNGRDAGDETVGEFLYRIPEYRERLADYPCSDNSEIRDKLDELLADECTLAREYHARRR